MTITIDCRWIDASGVGVYLQGCLPFFLDCMRGVHTPPFRALKEGMYPETNRTFSPPLPKQHTPSLQGGVVDSGNSFFLIGNTERLSPFLRGRKNVDILDCRIKPFSLRELFFFPRQLLKKINSGDLFYSPYFNIPGFIKIPVYTTIHDIIFPDMPELTSKIGLAARMWFYRRAFKRSQKIFTVSEFSKSRIAHYSQHRVPVIVTHSAVRRWTADTAPGGSSQHCIPGKKENKKKNIILFIGNIKKHKGLSILIEAFLQARHEGLEHKLIIVGSRENFRSADSNFSSGLISAGSIPADPGLVEFTGFLSDEKLLTLLGEASLLVQPSLYEGFCLPPLEALAAGTSVLISDIPVLREIYQEYPEQALGQGFPVNWFKAGDVQDLKEKLLSLLHNKQLEEITLPEKLENLYTFEKTSRTILTHLEEK